MAIAVLVSVSRWQGHRWRSSHPFQVLGSWGFSIDQQAARPLDDEEEPSGRREAHHQPCPVDTSVEVCFWGVLEVPSLGLS